MAELIPVRPGEELDMTALRPYLDTVFGSGQQVAWTVQQFSAGHSNLTYLLSRGDMSVVLRRPPLGPVAPRAHDMVREARFLTALHPDYRWAPEVYAVSNDRSVLGVPFFLMEPRQGVLLDRTYVKAHPLTEDAARRVSDNMVSRLVDLHRVDWRSGGLSAMVRPEGFLERQVEGWIGRYQGAKTEDIAGVELLCQWLLDHLPIQCDSTVIHYDYKLNNVLFTPELADLAGVFDWEMATVGDPLADLAVTASYWTEKSDPEVFTTTFGETALTVEPGFYSREDLIQAYSAQSGRDIHDFGYYLTFAYFKMAVIIAQIYYRYWRGQTQDPRFRHFGQVTRQLLELAMQTQLKTWGD